MKLSEPTTSITDFLLAAELFLFSYVTLRSGTDQISVTLWGIALATLGFSALAGGIYHGISPNIHFWRMTAICIVATLGFMIAAGIISTSSGFIRASLIFIAELPLLILMVRLIRQKKGSIRIRHSKKRIVILMIVLSFLLAYQLYSGGPQIGIWLLTGSLIIFAGLWIHQTELGLHRHFNHNDICHVLFMIGVYFLYRGGVLFRDR